MRKRFRFSLNDRVCCYCGPRWLSGQVVGAAVPQDSEDICVQEVCFDPDSEMHLVNAASQSVSESSKPKLRFAVGDKIMCRVSSSPEDADDLEKWVPGTISEIWPKIPGELEWTLGDKSGT